MNTATSDRVIETIVKPISRAPSSAAVIGSAPSSMWRTMFSSITMASSTTKPTASVSAISDRLFRLKPSRCIAANVPMIEAGSARLGMTVADRLRRNRKMTSTTSTTVKISVSWMSWIDSRIDCERSSRICRFSAAGSCAWICGSSRLMASTVSTVLAPGWRLMAIEMLRAPLNQLACLSFSTPS